MGFEKIKLFGGAEVTIDFSFPEAKCAKCNKPIRWAVTKNSKNMPIIKEGENWKSHFSDCQYADDFRKSKIQI